MPDIGSGFIKNYTSGVPSSQRSSILALVEEQRKAGHILSLDQLKREAQKRLNEIKARGRAFVFENFGYGERISSERVNDSFHRIFTDLRILYDQIALISSDQSRISAVTQDSFIKSRAAINILINDLRLFQFLRANPEYQDAKYINFNTATNRTGLSPKAEVDTDTKSLRLPLRRGSTRLARSRFNLDRVTVETSHAGGGLVSGFSDEFKPELSIDSDPKTFWGEAVLVERRPQHKINLSHSFEGTRNLGSGIQSGTKFESNGVVFIVEYSFDRTIVANNLKLWPIASHPMKLVDLAYKSNDQAENWLSFNGFDPGDYEETLDWIEWNGPRTSCVKIRVMLEQANYGTNIYHVPENLVKNNQLWQQAADSSFSRAIHDIELTEAISDKIAATPEMLTYLNEVDGFSKDFEKLKLEPGAINEIQTIELLQDALAKRLGRVDAASSNSFTSGFDTAAIADSDLLEIKRLEYIGGIREFQVNDNVYEPFAAYESQKFESNSNVLEVSLLTEEEHLTTEDALIAEQFQRSSIEYEVELSDDLVFNIVPYNQRIKSNAGDGIRIKDELLIPSRINYKAISRHAFHDSTVSQPAVDIRKNGSRLSPIVLNSGGSLGALLYNYETEFSIRDGYSYVEITFNDKYFDPRAVYTMSYLAHIDAAVIDINDRITSRETLVPEEHPSTDRNNRIRLNYYPYIEYSIINDTGVWRQEDPTEPIWSFVPATLNYGIGTAHIDSGTTTSITGANTFWTTDGPNLLVTGDNFGLTGASIMFQGDNRAYEIQSIDSQSGLTTSTGVDLGFLGSNPSTDLNYVIGKSTEIDGILYGLSNNLYEPIQVFINDIKAKSRTNYQSLEHYAFTDQPDNTKRYEYIQAGKNLFFNAPAAGKVEVSYRYLTQYIKVNALLRSNEVVRPKNTPVINNYTIRIKNSKI
jgi:hypothetical protein